MYLNNNFLRVARLNKVRFKLFALRDDLALLAMRGLVKEDGIEYRTLTRMLNESIKIMGHFSIIDFLKYVVAIHKDEKLRDNMNSILKKIEHHNIEYKVIVHEYFYTMNFMLHKHLRILRIVLPILMICVSLFSLLRAIVVEKARIIQDVELEYKEKLGLTKEHHATA
jgi:hypothetical protein